MLNQTLNKLGWQWNIKKLS